MIRIADLSTGETYRIDAGEGEFVQIQGFWAMIWCMAREERVMC